MTHPKDIKISAPEKFSLLNDPDFLNQIVTRYLQQFLEAEITSFLQAEPYQRTGDRTGYRNAGLIHRTNLYRSEQIGHRPLHSIIVCQ